MSVGISPQQFEQLQKRLSSPRRAKASAAEDTNHKAQTLRHKIILGIDPSLRGTGFGIIRIGSTQQILVVAGTIKCPSTWLRSRCLALIHETLSDILRKYKPEVCVFEALFFAQNLQTALLMGEARGAAMAAVAATGIDMHELAPRKVKQAIVGYGAAQKSAVAKMVQRMLGLAEPPAPDAADALALALAHAQEAGRYGLTSPKRI